MRSGAPVIIGLLIAQPIEQSRDSARAMSSRERPCCWISGLLLRGFGAKRAAGILEGGSTWLFGTYKRGWRLIAGTAAIAAMRITPTRPMPDHIPASS